MIADPWAIPAACYSIIVKRDAVIRSFPDGIEGFERAYSPAKNGALFRVVCMNFQDLDAILQELEDNGLVAGRDVAAVDMMHGPLLESEGVVFTTNEYGLCWWVNTQPAGAQTE